MICETCRHSKGHFKWCPAVMLTNDSPNPPKLTFTQQEPYDPVNPPHYKRGPEIELGKCDTYGKMIMDGWRLNTFERGGRRWLPLECIEIVRHIKDFRLANAMKYVWRVAFGGKVGADDKEDIKKAIWYLNDWLENEA